MELRIRSDAGLTALFHMSSINRFVSQEFECTNRIVGEIVRFYFSAKEFQDVILKGMEEFHNKTCIRFRKWKTGDKSWIRIKSDEDGCFATVGQYEGGQNVNLQIQTATEGGCVYHGTVVHELMHSVG